MAETLQNQSTLILKFFALIQTNLKLNKHAIVAPKICPRKKKEEISISEGNVFSQLSSIFH